MGKKCAYEYRCKIEIIFGIVKYQIPVKHIQIHVKPIRHRSC